jgi:hypothetical protein
MEDTEETEISSPELVEVETPELDLLEIVGAGPYPAQV